MNGFALLWGKILDSSIWVKESKETRLVWIAILAMKNSEGVIQASTIGLADRAKVSPDECREALRIFLSPDPDDTSKVEGGRRLREVPGGWQVVNHDMYRFSTEEKREHWRQAKAEQRRLADLRRRTPGQIGYQKRIRELGRKLKAWKKIPATELGKNGNPTPEQIAAEEGEYVAATMPK